MVWPQSPAPIRRSRAGWEQWRPRAKGKRLGFGVGSWGLLCPLPSPLPCKERCLGVSPGPGYSVAPYFCSPSTLLYCSADFSQSNTTSSAACPDLRCLWVTQCPSWQCQLPPRPSWVGAEEQTPELEAKICILKSHICFFPGGGWVPLNTSTLSPILGMPPLSSGDACPHGFALHGQVRSRRDSPDVGFLWCRLRWLHPAPPLA